MGILSLAIIGYFLDRYHAKDLPLDLLAISTLASIAWTRTLWKFHIRKDEYGEFMAFAKSDFSRLFPHGLHESEDSEDSEDERPATSSTCFYCKQEIPSTDDAVTCKICNRRVHKNCRKNHRRDAHGKTSSLSTD